MILPMLERLKQRSRLKFHNHKNKHRSFEKENRMYTEAFSFTLCSFKISTKLFMIEKSIYLRSEKRTNNLQKARLFGNTS